MHRIAEWVAKQDEVEKERLRKKQLKVYHSTRGHHGSHGRHWYLIVSSDTMCRGNVLCFRQSMRLTDMGWPSSFMSMLPVLAVL